MPYQDYARSFKEKAVERLNKIAYFIEVAMALVLLAAVLVLLIELIIESGLFSFTGEHLDFDEFLAKAFTLIIGVEFTKMLCRHTADTVVEVLLFATARQIVISHISVVETMVGVLAIAVLFAVKKFILTNNMKLNPESSKVRCDADMDTGADKQTAEKE